MPKHNMDMTARIRMAPGARHKLAKHAGSLGMKKPLVVTDPGVAALDWFSEMIEEARGAGLDAAVFSDVAANPDLANIAVGTDVFTAGGHDGVISVGGGSAMDAAKSIAVCATQEGELLDYCIDASERRRLDAGKLPPTLAMPTTAGTGSELSAGSIVLDKENGMKRTVAAGPLQPQLVLADPETTVGLPAQITAATGIDALTHALEAYSVPTWHPIADGIALEAIQIIHTELRAVMADPNDVEARGGMLLAAGMGALAFSKGLGLCHAMAHPVGAVLGLHHGLSNAVLLPYVLEHNRKPLADKLAHLSRVLDLPSTGFAGVYGWLMSLLREVGIEPSLGQAAEGAGDHLDELVDKTLQERFYLSTNPVPADADTIRGIFELSLRA